MAQYWITYEGQNRCQIGRRGVQFPVSGSHLTVGVGDIRLICHQVGGKVPDLGCSNVIVDRCTNWIGLTDLLSHAEGPIPCEIIKWGVDPDVVREAPRVPEATVTVKFEREDVLVLASKLEQDIWDDAQEMKVAGIPECQPYHLTLKRLVEALRSVVGES